MATVIQSLGTARAVTQGVTNPSTPAAQLVVTTDGEGNLGGNQDITLITAVGATVTQASADQVNVNGRGVKVVLDMATVGTGSVTLTVQGKDVASGKYYTLLAGAAVTTNVTNVYTVFPGATAAANVAANDLLPHTWRVLVTANNANPTIYTVGASAIS